MGCIYNGVCPCCCDGTLVFHLGDMGVYVFEFFVDLCNLREICVSNMVIHLA